MLIPTLKHTLLACALLAATAGQAADKAKESSFGKGKAGGPTLTREQLRQCLSQQSQLKEVDTDLAKLQATLASDKAAIVRSGEVLTEQGAALDRSQPEAVTAYNELVLARNEAIGELQARGAQFNTRVGDAQAQHEAFAKACDGRSYFETDGIAIQKGK
ncbi:MAG: hypothetical protein ABI671_14915 [Burkholderiales bacterium]